MKWTLALLTLFLFALPQLGCDDSSDEGSDLVDTENTPDNGQEDGVDEDQDAETPDLKTDDGPQEDLDEDHGGVEDLGTDQGGGEDGAGEDQEQDTSEAPTKAEIWAEGLEEGVNWGIASDYPNDVGLAAHPAVYATEDFESGQVQLFTEEDRLLEDLVVVGSETHTGNYAGEFSWPQGESGRTTRFPLPQDPADNPGGAYFMRVCYNYDGSFHPGDQTSGVGVKGFGINAEGEGTNANTPCDGTNWYNAQVQFVGWGGSSKPQANDGFLWVGHLYSYNPDPEAAVPEVGTLEVSNPSTGDQPYRFSSYGDPFDYIQFNTWRCYEVGLYLNTPGENDGEARFWIDGVLQSRLTNMRYRDLAALLPTSMHVNLYRTTTDFPQTMVRWIDNIVLSRRYIGPVGE